MDDKAFRPDQVSSYFKKEWFPLLLTTISGLIYNIGLLAAPYFEGQMAECLLEILQGHAVFSAMLILVLEYIGARVIVQGARYIKRFYVRRFANNVNRRMKKTLYASLIKRSRASLEEEGTGNVITKAISDVDDCAEGMRKFTTEVFDTGVAMVCYICMLLVYDWRLGLLCMIFPPISYFIAEKMKTVIQRNGAAFKKSSGALSAATLDRAENALTYRVFGIEDKRTADYELHLEDYEKKAVKSNIWTSSLPPLYRIISMLSVLFILYFGAKNVTQTGWTAWTIASFTTFLSCFTKLSVKSSRAAKLFNAVHKAQVSWGRIKPYLESEEPVLEPVPAEPSELSVRELGFAYSDGARIFSNVAFNAAPGQIVGITGPVACGKSTLGRVFLLEGEYKGSIAYGGKELSAMSEPVRRGIVSYLGHDPEILSASIKDNILLGNDETGLMKLLHEVRFDDEVSEMENGVDTLVGSGGVRLSGGQSQRLALARTLNSRRPLMVLDDPFSALDRNTEQEIFKELKAKNEGIILLISHRLYLFPEMDKVLWMNNGKVTCGTHESLMNNVPEYRDLYTQQCDAPEEGGSHEA